MGNLYWTLRAAIASPSDKKYLALIWENLLKTRIFEKKVLQLAEYGRIEKKWIFTGFQQEIGQSVIATLLGRDEYILPSYRGYAAIIGKGVPLDKIASEILCKEDGPLYGLGPSTSFTSPEFGIYQHSDILGLDFGTAIGMGMAIKRKYPGKLLAVFFGDGAALRGPLWSAINLSIVKRLPILWICENNQYSFATRVSETTVTPFFKKAAGFGMDAHFLDGSQGLRIFFKTKEILDKMRFYGVPIFMEILTYRTVPHDLFFMKNCQYQNIQERNHWLNNDGFVSFERQLVGARIIEKHAVQAKKDHCTSLVEKIFDVAAQKSSLSYKDLCSVL